jgi:hypothetical protein
MFDLDFTSASAPSVSMDHYREWAGEIANSYFNANAEPTSTLKKIAQVEELTPHQIEVLAAEANKLIHQQKFASADEKYFAANFPLADAGEVVKGCQVDGGETKVAADFSAPQVSDQGPDAFDMFGVEDVPMSKTASIKHNLKTAHIKLKHLQQKTQDQLIMQKHANIINEKKFIKEARQAMIEEPNSAARVEVFKQFDQFVKSAGFEQGRVLLAKTAYVLAREGKLEPSFAKKAMDYYMSKTADQKAPEELISENLPARIINGNHPLYVTLKTIADGEAEALRYENSCSLIDDKLRVVEQKIRAL